jgi:hypothetical protein
MASFVHVLSQQTNGLGIFLNVLRIHGVRRFQVGKVKKVMIFGGFSRSKLDFEGLNVVVDISR